MTKITYKYDVDRVKIKAEGHSEYANAGSDIVCASISTAMLLARIFYHKYFSNVSFEVDEETTTMAITIKSKSPRAKDAMQILEGFFRDLEYDYPKYVKVEEAK